MTAASAVLQASLSTGIPSPSQGTWDLWFIPIRAYALLILSGIAIGTYVADRRWTARGGQPGTVLDVVMWAVPAGIVGARVYHVLSRLQDYVGPGRDPWDVLRIWEGGLAIFGGLLGGALGAWLACRRHEVALPAFADALAPGIAIAQAVGRWGNYFNQELFGTPTDLPWGLRIDPENRPAQFSDSTTFHPTFLYESLWNLGVAGIVVWADRRFRLGHGRAFALYLACYASGRAWLELLRTDPANLVLGVRVNQLTALLVVLCAVAYIVISARVRPGRETTVQIPPDASSHGSTDDAPGNPEAGPAGAAGQGTPQAAGRLPASAPPSRWTRSRRRGTPPSR